jgi:predicted metal-dependent hydrolase
VAAAAVAAAVRSRIRRERAQMRAESSEEVPELVLKGIEEFNKGEFYECHEYLEEAWMQEPRRVRFLYQGILQVGVGFYHQRNGNWRGATGLLRNGTIRLKEFEPVTLGIDVARLIRECERCLEELEKLGRERVREFDQTRVPKVEWA